MHAQKNITETFGSSIQVQYILLFLSTHSKVYAVIRYRLHSRSRHLETAPIHITLFYVCNMGPYEIWALWNMGLSARKYILHVYCVYMTKWEIEYRHNVWNTTLFSYIHTCFAWRLYPSKGSLFQIEFVLWKETILISASYRNTITPSM